MNSSLLSRSFCPLLQLICFLPAAIAAPVEKLRLQPFPEVTYQHFIQAEPPQQIFVARIDLADPDVEVRVAPGGADPDGAGEFQTTLQTPTVIAERERFEVTINGDFFSVKKPDTPSPQSGYFTGQWAKVVGPSVTDGHLWAPAAEARGVLWLDTQKRPHVLSLKDVPADAYQIMAGSHVLVQESQTRIEAQSTFSRTRHPRKAVGIDREGKTLILVVVDGRRPGEAAGMSLTELADFMQQIGCYHALNLDGGGSSTFVLRDSARGELHVKNRPSDNRERPVANVLGISIRGSRRLPKQLPSTTE